jgi:hypothetical protein
MRIFGAHGKSFQEFDGQNKAPGKSAEYKIRSHSIVTLFLRKKPN